MEPRQAGQRSLTWGSVLAASALSTEGERWSQGKLDSGVSPGCPLTPAESLGFLAAPGPQTRLPTWGLGRGTPPLATSLYSTGLPIGGTRRHKMAAVASNLPLGLEG